MVVIMLHHKIDYILRTLADFLSTFHSDCSLKIEYFFYDSIIPENYRTKTIQVNGGVSDQSIL